MVVRGLWEGGRALAVPVQELQNICKWQLPAMCTFVKTTWVQLVRPAALAATGEYITQRLKNSAGGRCMRGWRC